MHRSKPIDTALALACLFHFGLLGWAAGQIGRQVKNAAKKVVRPVVSALVTKQVIQTVPKLLH